MKKMNVLYISIIGMSEPLGKSQVLEYLQDLSLEYNISLYTFEKNLDTETLKEIQTTMDQYNIHWSYQKYSNKYGVFTTLQQIISSIFDLKGLVTKNNIKIIHARSMIPVLIALALKVMYKVKVLFDIRGFQVDEKAEVGRMKHASILYKTLKFLEKYAYQKSDAIVTLTYASKKIIDEITEPEKVTVIPTCANRNVFKVMKEEEKKAFKHALGYATADKIIIHAGTVSNWYDFNSELLLMQRLMLKDPNIHFLILNKGEHLFIEKKLGEYTLERSKVNIMEVNFYEMYKYLNIAEASLFIIKPTYSKTASAPTKFAENLACGLFSITNDGIGDMDTFFIEHPEVGYAFDVKEIDNALDTISDNILKYITKENVEIDAYIKLYDKYLSKEMAVEKYTAIYNTLTKEK